MSTVDNLLRHTIQHLGWLDYPERKEGICSEFRNQPAEIRDMNYQQLVLNSMSQIKRLQVVFFCRNHRQILGFFFCLFVFLFFFFNPIEMTTVTNRLKFFS